MLEMTKFKNIAISGLIGTGKTTLSRNLSEALGWEQLNVGEFFKDWFRKQGIPVEQTSKVPEEMDREIDLDLKEKMKSANHMIFETKLAGYLAHDIDGFFKIHCIADFREMARRVAKREGIAVTEAKKSIRVRAKGLQEKFKRLYGVEDYLDEKYFDLVVDTTTKNKQEVLDFVLLELRKKRISSRFARTINILLFDCLLMLK